MKSLLSEISKAITNIKGCQFASLTYLSKTDGSLARYTVNLGFSYHKAVVQSVTDLEIIIGEITDKASLRYQAALEVMESLKKTLTAHEQGTQNEDYTKKDQYISIGNGLNVNTTDNSLQLFGLLHSKVVLREGEPKKKVNSKPLTIEKNRIRRELTIGKFREFALDKANIAGVKVNGETLEVLSPEGYGFTVNPPNETVAGVTAAVLVMGDSPMVTR